MKDAASRLLVAIVADDLTGALDAAAPFAAAGLATIAAVDPSRIVEALAAKPDVLSVNTRSRQATDLEAAANVAAVARALRVADPQLVFLKVDSRLKGAVAASVAAALQAFRRERAIVCPAVPQFGRVVRGGVLRGSGLPAPIAIEGLLSGLASRLEIPDGLDSATLRMAGQTAWADRANTLTVGARDLAVAIAALLARPHAKAGFCPVPLPALALIGSRDPVTREQLTHVQARLPRMRILEAPNGHVPTPAKDEPVSVIAMSTVGSPEDADTVASRFARGASDHVRAQAPASLILSGGDTADAVLTALDVGVLRVLGEAEPGIAVSQALASPLTVATKSGGFGQPETLVRLLSGV